MNRILFLVCAISAGSLVFSCKRPVSQDAANTPFCLTDTLQNKIAIAEVKKESVKNSILLSGKIEANEDKWVKVYPVVGGVVQEMKVQLGDYVKKGQVLAVIHSSEIADLQSQLSASQSNVATAEKALIANKEMFASGLATERDVSTAENELNKARSELLRNKQINNIYGARGNALQTITAPISGYIIEKNVTDKMQYRVDGSQPFFIISNLDEVWVMASVFESDIAKIKEGYDANINVIAYKDRVFHGKVDRMFAILDPQSRVMKVRIRIKNEDNLLKPEMFAQINILYNSADNELPAIPSGAVVFSNNKNYVMVYRNNCDIETREIDVFQTIGETSYINAGLEPGEKIITRYQLLIYDALND
ncbi:MAG: efflux RND transporter periplasmic adaptor subunit [Chitinophagaceae bacterium]|nr:efflux RND transporter periplasmic adaptor subunit [Chitinophagaceae bacterium]